MQLGTVIFFLLLIAGASWAFRRIYRRAQEAEHDLAESNAKYIELSDFLNCMIREQAGPEEEGIRGAMNLAAHHVADQTGADAVAIYEFTEGKLVASGLHGVYPLFHSKNRLVMGTHKLFEVLNREAIKIDAPGFLSEVASIREAQCVPSGANDIRFNDYPDFRSLGSVMAVPIVHEKKLLGLMCAVGSRKGARLPFTEEQFARFQALAPQIIIARNLMEAYGRSRRQERLDQELKVTRQIQLSLLPPSPSPVWGEFSINAVSQPLKEVNGDYYDFVEIDNDRLLVVIGDARGKGIPACMTAAMTRGMVRAVAENFTNLPDFLRNLNHKMKQNTDPGNYITLGCCLLDRRQNLIEYGCAGHTELLTYVRNHIRATHPSGGGLGASFDEDVPFDSICLSFEPGMKFLLFSDGFTEAVNKEGEEFGVERLKDVFLRAGNKNMPAREAAAMISKEVSDFAPEAADDQTLILIEHRPLTCRSEFEKGVPRLAE